MYPFINRQGQSALESNRPLRTSILISDKTYASSLLGVYDVLSTISNLHRFDPNVPAEPPFQVEIVSSTGGKVRTASGLEIETNHAIDDIEQTDLIVIPSIMHDTNGWVRGAEPETTRWLRNMHANGTLLCSTCSGVFMLAETGLLDGLEATLHWAHVADFQAVFPEVHLNVERLLVTSGGNREFVMGGGSSSWQDLVLYLIARFVGYPTAYAVSNFYVMRWHWEQQTPFYIFTPSMEHGDSAILRVQKWLEKNFSGPNPVVEMTALAEMPQRSFIRRFQKATGLTPIQYVQQLRVDRGKRLLEQTTLPIEDVSWKVGYEDAAFFRRLFKRLTGVTPGAYRKNASLPDFSDY
ncbi:MAG: helix-turn-helix domain-containing protein [Alphaproteobacteria bacterium]